MYHKNIEIIYKSKLSNIFPEIHNKMNGNRNNSRHVKTYKVQHLRTFEVTPKNVLPNTQTAVELLMQGCYTYVRSFNMSIDDNNDEPYLILSDPRNGDVSLLLYALLLKYLLKSVIYCNFIRFSKTLCKKYHFISH